MLANILRGFFFRQHVGNHSKSRQHVGQQMLASSVGQNVVSICAAFKDCTWRHGFYSSPEFVFPGKDARGKKPFEVNVRSVIAFREIDKGNEAIRTFTTMMNMPPPLSHQSYNDINLNLHYIYEKAAKESMLAAVNDLKKKRNISIDENLDKSEVISH